MAIKTHLVRSTAALDSIVHFEKLFTSKYCGYGKIYHMCFYVGFLGFFFVFSSFWLLMWIFLYFLVILNADLHIVEFVHRYIIVYLLWFS